MKSLKFQLLVPLGITITVILLCVMAISYWITSKMVESNLEERFQIQAQEIANAFDIRFQKEKTVIDSFGKQVAGDFPAYQANDQAQFEFTKRMHDTYTEWNPVSFIADLSAKKVATSAGKYVDASALAYIKKIPEGKTFMDSPIVAVTTGKAIVVGAAPVTVGNNVAGAVVGGIPLEKFTDGFSEMKIGADGYCIITAPDGIITSHPNAELVMKTNIKDLQNQDLTDAMQNISQGKKGFMITSVNGVESLVAYVPTEDKWGVFTVAPVAQEFAAVKKLTWMFIILFVVGLGIAVLVINWLAGRVTRPVREMSQYVEAIAKGDLSKETLEKADRSKYSAQDEIGTLRKAMLGMREELWNLMHHVDEASGHTASSSLQLKESSNQAAQTAAQVAESVTKVSEQTIRGQKAMNEVNQVFDGFMQDIGKMKDNTQDANSFADTAVEKTQSGTQTVQSARAQMENINNSSKNVTDAVTELSKGTAKIGEIVNIISGIAAQTNLLALNAAIEAARAGEHGRGFAVVADEVRKLAEQSQDSAGQIISLIAEINQDVETAVTAVEHSGSDVGEGIENVVAAEKQFLEIAELIQNVQKKTAEVLSYADKLVDDGRKVEKSSAEINQAMNETAASSQSVSAATEEQSAAMQEIAASSDDLAQLAEKLKTSIQKFKL
ncbi:methyl-accepting chemotaxis protein [Pectinatus cerevisiiphilus]|uniref:Methyl-accepting chemotaxis sensory transducer with Cache sensor n=2 Tax=Pectinatus cerevisiiphilus TaxID=86956 RepID=A0A4R3K7K7_9FIRM|nr:methyl-accepting chemotaxis protein [Pectinatus cerevisiiphilus]TCS78946.1 methyl-accepting chemotaxis sensory transducer with Cache sensor [Pectinatus cerevisiiphilus]